MTVGLWGISIMKVGFTGTQQGMTSEQEATVGILLRKLKATEFHHGDCIGADAQAHSIAIKAKLYVVIHPPTNSSKRAFCKDALIVHPTAPYLVRNHNIVDDTTVLIATPSTETEELRSGTWATVRYAVKCKRRVLIVVPNGTVVEKANQ